MISPVERSRDEDRTDGTEQAEPNRDNVRACEPYGPGRRVGPEIREHQGPDQQPGDAETEEWRTEFRAGEQQAASGRGPAGLFRARWMGLGNRLQPFEGNQL